MFVFAGAAKLEQLPQFVQMVPAYELLPHSLAPVYGYALRAIEVTVGALLILGVFVRAGSVIRALIVVSFVIARSFALARGVNLTYGCFGQWAEMLV